MSAIGRWDVGNSAVIAGTQDNHRMNVVHRQGFEPRTCGAPA